MPLGEPPTCPLCDGQEMHFVERDHTFTVECERCGCFKITSQEIHVFLKLNPQYKPLLSAYCRRLPKGAEAPTIRHDNVEHFIRTLPQFTPPEKLDILLELMGRMTPGLGEQTRFSAEADYPLLIGRSPEEVRFLIEGLLERDYIRGPGPPVWGPFIVSSLGWERLEEIKRSGRSSNRAFVAMWFDKSTDDLYNAAIKPAILKAGYDPLRIDRLEHVNRIDDEIIGQIKRSRFMVADFTG